MKGDPCSPAKGPVVGMQKPEREAGRVGAGMAGAGFLRAEDALAADALVDAEAHVLSFFSP